MSGRRSPPGGGSSCPRLGPKRAERDFASVGTAPKGRLPVRRTGAGGVAALTSVGVSPGAIAWPPQPSAGERRTHAVGRTGGPGHRACPPKPGKGRTSSQRWTRAVRKDPARAGPFRAPGHRPGQLSMRRTRTPRPNSQRLPERTPPAIPKRPVCGPRHGMTGERGANMARAGRIGGRASRMRGHTVANPRPEGLYLGPRGRCVMVRPQPSKLMIRVRFPSPAPPSLLSLYRARSARAAGAP